MRRYGTAAAVYAALALAGGVFYREFTKLQGFAGKTALSVVHAHYMLLGVVLLLLLALLERSLSFTTPAVRRGLIVYHVGLNLTAGMLAVRGVLQVLGTELSAGLDASISGAAGIGHLLLGGSLLWLLLQLRRRMPA